MTLLLWLFIIFKSWSQWKAVITLLAQSYFHHLRLQVQRFLMLLNCRWKRLFFFFFGSFHSWSRCSASKLLHFCIFIEKLLNMTSRCSNLLVTSFLFIFFWLESLLLWIGKLLLLIFSSSIVSTVENHLLKFVFVFCYRCAVGFILIFFWHFHIHFLRDYSIRMPFVQCSSALH